jgi:hypothetical protein
MACLDENTLAAFVERLLPEEAVARIEEHVDGCGACRRLLSTLVSLVDDGSSERPLRVESLEPGTMAGRYVVLSRIAAGAMGVVYAAFDRELDRKVALKLLRPAADDGDAADRRLLREAQAMARLSHANVVTVYDTGTVGGAVFVAMEFLAGGTVAGWMREPRPWRDVVAKFALAGRGLEAAHRAGLVHRDFKPDNVLLDGERVCVADFGLVRALGPSGPEARVSAPVPAEPSGDERVRRTTAANGIAGTPAYMAPEQLQGQAATPASDQFSFCAALHEALYRELPFAGGDATELLRAAIEGRVRPARAGSPVPARLRRAVLRGLSAEPAERHADMTALLAALEYDPARPRRHLLALGAGLALAAALAVVGLRAHAAASACESGDEALERVWGDARREQVRSSFLATNVPYAEVAWTRVRGSLDAYASELGKARVANCEAKEPAPVVALRSACLDQRSDELRTLVDVFAHADAHIVETSHEAVDSLTGLGGCADTSALAGRMKLPEPATAARVDALRRELARAKALLEGGREGDARVAAERLVGDARQTGYRPLLAEALLLRGQASARAADDAGSVKALFEAVGHAEASRDDEVAAMAWSMLVREHIAAAADVDASTSALARAHAAVDRLEGETGAGDVLAANEAFLIMSRGDLLGGAAIERRLILDLERRFGAGGLPLASPLFDLGRFLRLAGDASAARAAHVRAQSILEGALGHDHPRTLNATAELGLDLGELGDPSAEEVLESVIAGQERAYGVDDTHEVFALLGLAEVLDRAGPGDRGLDLARRGAAIEERTFGPHHLAIAFSQTRLAEALLRHGRFAEALATAQRADALWRSFRGIAQFELARARTSVGEAELVLHHATEAVAALDWVVAYADAHQLSEALRARAQFALARALVEPSGDRARARSLAMLAADSYRRAPGRTEEAARVDAWLDENR